MSLRELSLDDTSSANDQSLLFKLSSGPALGMFARVVLCSSPNDAYVPLHSARIQVPMKADRDSSRGLAIVKMTGNMLSHIRPERVSRLTLANLVSKNASSIDRLIGRADHISYLESHILVQQLIHSLYPALS